MSPAPPVLSVLRHALAGPLSAASVKVEVLGTRLGRDAPALSPRTDEIAADLAQAGRLLDLLVPLSALAGESQELLPLSRLIEPAWAEADTPVRERLVRVRPASAADALRRVVAFGARRGGTPRARAGETPGRVEVLVRSLGPAPPEPLERLLLLPRELPEAQELFLAGAALVADGGSLGLSSSRRRARGDSLLAGRGRGRMKALVVEDDPGPAGRSRSSSPSSGTKRQKPRPSRRPSRPIGRPPRTSRSSTSGSRMATASTW